MANVRLLSDQERKEVFARQIRASGWLYIAAYKKLVGEFGFEGRTTIREWMRTWGIWRGEQTRKGHHALGLEISMETVPGSIGVDPFASYRKAGIQRFDLGVCTTHPIEWESLERPHNYQSMYNSCLIMQFASFHEYGMDLLYGLPGQTPRTLLDSMDECLVYDPPHMSCIPCSCSPVPGCMPALWREGRIRAWPGTIGSFPRKHPNLKCTDRVGLIFWKRAMSNIPFTTLPSPDIAANTGRT